LLSFKIDIRNQMSRSVLAWSDSKIPTYRQKQSEKLMVEVLLLPIP